MTAAIIFDSVSKTYRQKRHTISALDNLNLEIKAGEVFGFVGPNGAGKSTTIKSLLNIISDYTGRILINGIDAHDHHARAGLAYVAESPILPPQLTPVELLQMGTALQGLKVDRKYCQLWLEKMGLNDYANRRIQQLSKGNIQRTALAHALVSNPRLLILDEPLSGLDPIGRAHVIDTLQEYRENGGTLFFSSHVLYDVERLADRFGLIHRGKLKTVQSPAEVLGQGQTFDIHTLAPNPNGNKQRQSYRVEQDKLWEKLAELKAEQHQLIAVSPTLSLEQVFLRHVNND